MSFSAWFEEAEKNAANGKDIVSSSSADASNVGIADKLHPTVLEYGKAINSLASSTSSKILTNVPTPITEASSWFTKSFKDATGVSLGGSSSQQEGEEDGDLEANSLINKSASSSSTGFSEQFTISKSERFKYFVALLVLSVIFFVSSFFFLPMVVLMPGKFAFSFTLGSISFMGAFALVQGPWNWLMSVCNKDRIGFTLAYFGSIVLTLYATVILKSYILTILASGVQLSTLVWYFTAYVPGGAVGMKALSVMIRNFFYACFQCCKGMSNMM